MALLTEFTRRLNSIAGYLENPQLLMLRYQGGIPNTFLLLNQPWFHSLNIETILDIGANVGQFALTINTLLPKARIYSFEPLTDCYEKLKARMADCKTFSAFNLALGDESGSLIFERNAYSPSSSFLKIADVHKKAFPKTQATETLEVKIDRLDNIAQQLAIANPYMVKIDVQGYEYQVLRGGEQTIKNARLVITETSFVTLYDNQPLFNDVYNNLINWGFTYVGALDQLYNPQDGRVLQADSIFIKSE
ncbi:FkbM family methyltransferase [Calothrix sp. NIES-2098]|uniref:FkbM family methyltransferase n=1 Tax=Calothrix sp. NIES-2098 TaxID=1954171 RepID=UPI000B621D65|nr:hypothetical protein NIES2098_60680 [Calothrix sp. NIES-2098]